MNIQESIRTRIRVLCIQHNIPLPDLEEFTEETPLETIEQLCDQLGISIADFFVDDLFRK